MGFLDANTRKQERGEKSWIYMEFKHKGDRKKPAPDTNGLLFHPCRNK